MNIANKLINNFNIDANNPDDARRRRLLNMLLIGIFLSALSGLLVIMGYSIILGTDVNKPDLELILAIGVFIISPLFLHFVNKYSGKVASLLFLLFFTLAVSFSDTPQQLANGRSLFVYTIPIAISSLLMFPSASFIFAIINSAIVAYLAIISSLYPNSPAIIGYFFLALVSWLSSRSLEGALNDLRIININLDKIVGERTSALAEALTRERLEAGRNQAILNSIADGVIVFNADNVAILANPALSYLTETPFQNLSGMVLDKFVQTRELPVSNQKMIVGLIADPEKAGTGIRIEWGKKILSVGVARVVDTTTNENIGTVAVFRDVTREAEHEKMKENFVAVVSHELRTPLNALMGLTEMLKEGIYGGLNEKQISIAERVMVNARRLLSMVGDLLDEAQINAGKLSVKPQNLKTSSLLENLHDTMDKIASDKGLTLISILDPSLPGIIRGDGARLQQILINLVNNAIKFTYHGSIKAHLASLPPKHWCIQVTDTGVGIPEDEIPHIFETFRQVDRTTTRQHGGFGLGLSIVKQLVELMGGEIKVKSIVGSGSTFTVILPLEISE